MEEIGNLHAPPQRWQRRVKSCFFRGEHICLALVLFPITEERKAWHGTAGKSWDGLGIVI